MERQGILYALNEYADYLSLSISLYGKIIEKYPRHLVMAHNILMRENNEKNNFKQYEESFKDAVSQWEDYEYAYGNYCIIKPTEAEDLVKEGTELSHCVASYVPKVANGDDVVLFMRSRKEKNVSLYTIEVIGDKVTQVEGYQQSSKISETQNDFLNYWALNKGLVIEAPITVISDEEDEKRKKKEKEKAKK
jgi:hypothetical protein